MIRAASGRYDLIVIGGGTAGLVSAAGGASLGARVALVERDRLGGDCLLRGCVPTKTLVKSARVVKIAREAAGFGVPIGDYEVDFPAVMARMNRVVDRAAVHDDPRRFRELGVDVFLGEEAAFAAPDAVEVDGRRLLGRSVIVATGSHSSAPPVEGLERTGYIDHVGALALGRLPRSVVVIGSGPIGCEFAQIFARFGSEVTMISSSPLPLPKEDGEIGEVLLRCLEAEGIRFVGNARAEGARREGDEKVVAARSKGADGHLTEVRAEEILVAAGRAPTLGSLRPENAGLVLDGKGLSVDDHMRTTSPGRVYAAGDITGKYLFTHVAEYQARHALRNALFPIGSRADHEVVPWTTFTDPEVARVGLTEEQARERHGDGVRVFRKPFSEVDRALTDGETDGLVKLVTTSRGKVLGGHIVGPDAGNLIHEVVLAMQRGIPVGALSTTIHVYPTLSQANQRAADLYYREKLFGGPAGRLFSAFFAARRALDRRKRG